MIVRSTLTWSGRDLMKSIKLPAEWTERREVFLKSAIRNLEEGIYWLSCFSAHQAVEFYLKTLLVSIAGVHPYTHDLAKLLDAMRAIGIEVPNDISLSCELLTPHYALARYPGKRTYNYTAER
ncbi:MAG: HEPN domain-containing protein [Desulfurococcaceae archaeon]|nr:HEPN domain-containing protein [Desulfurococcaceae archaeon]